MAKRIKVDPERLGRLKEILNRKNPKPYVTATRMTFWRGLIEDAVAILNEDPAMALELLKRAAKGSKRREDRRDHILLELGDVEHPLLALAADREISHLLVTAEEKRRDSLFQILAYHPSRIRFHKELHAVAADQDDPSWWAAVQACGILKDHESLDLLLSQTKGLETHGMLFLALVRMEHPKCRPFLIEMLQSNNPDTSVFTLWGLAALGHDPPLAKLIEWLDDPGSKSEYHSYPRESLRAAQAISKLMGWPFEWHGDNVPGVKARAYKHLGKAWIQCHVEAFDKGLLDIEERA